MAETADPDIITFWADLFRNDRAINSVMFVSSVALHALNIFVTTTIVPSVVRDICDLEVYA